MDQLSHSLEHNRIKIVMRHYKYIIVSRAQRRTKSTMGVDVPYTEAHFFTDDQRNHNYHNIFIRAGFDGQTLKTTLKVTTGIM